MPSVEAEANEGKYLFDTGSDPGREQVDLLSVLLDPVTTERLDGTGLKPGWRCLDVGTGSGSVARWMAERVGPEGSVVAVDVATDHVDDAPGVEVLRHDITHGVPGGPYDLIHARLVMMHLPERERLLTEFVDALAPGGWLVVGDLSGRTPYSLSTAIHDDGELFDRVLRTGTHVVAPAAGISVAWAHDAHGRMVSAGLEQVEGQEHSWTFAGGDHTSRYFRALVAQLRGPLARSGITESEQERFQELMLDPSLRGWFYQHVTTRGRKPTA